MVFVVLPAALAVLACSLTGLIWLAVLGDWPTIGYGFGYSIVASVLLQACMLATVPSQTKRGLVVRALLSVLSVIWIYTLAFASALLVVYFATKFAAGADEPRPYLLWAFALCVGPWLSIANQHAALSPLFLASLGMTFGAGAALSAYFFFDQSSLLQMGKILGGALAAFSLLHLIQLLLRKA